MLPYLEFVRRDFPSHTLWMLHRFPLERWHKCNKCEMFTLWGSQMAVTWRTFEVLIFFSISSLSQPQPSVLIVSYIESAKAAAQFGFYQKAEWKPDDSMIAVAVSAWLYCTVFKYKGKLKTIMYVCMYVCMYVYVCVCVCKFSLKNLNVTFPHTCMQSPGVETETAGQQSSLERRFTHLRALSLQPC